MMPVYAIPAGLLLLSLLPQKYQSAAGSLASLGLLYLLGGWKLPLCALAGILAAWLYQRLMPAGKKAAQFPAAALLTGLLLAERYFFTPLQCLPLLLLTARHILCAHDRAENALPVVGLLPYCGYALSLHTLLTGPVLHFPAYQAELLPKAVSGAERSEQLGAGASRCIRGIFLLEALSLPMQRLSGELLPYVRSLPDYFTLAGSVFFAVYFGLKGLCMVCRGLAGMRGTVYPRSFETPVAADSLRGFVKRFWVWFTAVLTAQTPQKTFAYFLYTAWLLMTCGTVLADNMLCGMFWGLAAALMLTAEYSVPAKEMQVLPVHLRRALTLLLVLIPFPFLYCGSLAALGRCLAAWGGGMRLTGTVRYLAGNMLLLFPLCIAGLFPVRRMLYRLCNSPRSRSLLLIARPFTETLMLLFSAAALYSNAIRG